MPPAERNAEIAQLRQDGATLEQIAHKFGISRQEVWRVLHPRPKVTGRPCPRCQGSSKTIRTKPPTVECTEREHRCLECGYRWVTEQRDRETPESSSAHM